MPDLVFSPCVPHNPVNFSVPSGLSMWWRSRCPNGSLDTPIELGSISDIEFTPNETVLDMKGTRTGKMSTVARSVTDISGTLSFKIHEMVGSNLNLLFRPVTTNDLTGVNGKVIYGQTRVNLNGTTATEFAPDAVDYIASTGATIQKDVTIIRVQDCAIADAVSGLAAQFTDTVDYTFVQAASSTTFQFAYTAATGAFDIGETLSLPISAEYDTGTSPGTAADVGEVFTSVGGIVPFDTGNGVVPGVGDVLVDGTGTTPTAVIVGVELTTTTSGNLYVAAPVGGTMADFADNDAITTAEGFVGQVNGAGVAMTMTAVAAGFTTDNAGGLTIAASGSLFLASVANFTAGATLTAGSFGVFVGGTNGASISVNAVNAAVTFTVAAIDTAAGTVDVTGTAADFANVFANQRLTGGTSTETAEVTTTAQTGSGTAATIARVASGSITDGQEVVITYSYQRDGFEYSILDGVIITGQLQLQVMSVEGPQSIYTFNQVNLSQDGPIAINPEARTEPTMVATILPDGLGRRGTFTLLKTFSGFSLSAC